MTIVSSLKTKIIVSVSAILSVTIGLGTWINIGYQRAQMEDALEDNVLIISNTIEKSLATAMLQGKSREVQSILEAVGGYHNIQQVKIFSPTGVILKSSRRWTIGRRVGRVDAEVVPRRKVQKAHQAAKRRNFLRALPHRERRTMHALPRVQSEAERDPCGGSFHGPDAGEGGRALEDHVPLGLRDHGGSRHLSLAVPHALCHHPHSRPHEDHGAGRAGGSKPGWKCAAPMISAGSARPSTRSCPSLNGRGAEWNGTTMSK